MVTELEELVAQIQENYKIQKKVGEPLSINTYSTTGVDGKFAFSQRLIDCLLRMRANEQDHIELIDLCMKEYEGNKNELARINQFQTSYSSNRAIWWYTRESFFYKTLNAALRTQAVHMMFLYRSFISDIYEQLRRYQSKTKLTVYRSQLISNDELETLKQNIGQLISVNSFFSSSRDRETAVFLFGDIGNPIVDSERVLFEIDADPRMADSKPFSDIGILSQFAEEAEVLFMFGSIFRVNSIEHENERVWVIRMTLCSDEEHDLQQILAHMKRQNGSGVTNLRTLGEILSTMGEFTLAEYYYSRFVDQLSSDDPQRVTLYEDLAKTASQKRNFDGSIKWQRKALEFKQLKGESTILILQRKLSVLHHDK